jgi:hypothetical protein
MRRLNIATMIVQRHQLTRVWNTKETESSVIFISPEGFVFEYGGVSEICETLARIVEGSQITTLHNEVLDIIDGELVVLKHDSWTNKGFSFQDNAGNVVELAKILIKYLKQVIDANSR